MTNRINLLSWLFGDSKVAQLHISLTTDEKPGTSRPFGLLKRPRRGHAPPGSLNTHLLRDIGLDRSRC